MSIHDHTGAVLIRQLPKERGSTRRARSVKRSMQVIFRIGCSAHYRIIDPRSRDFQPSDIVRVLLRQRRITGSLPQEFLFFFCLRRIFHFCRVIIRRIHDGVLLFRSLHIVRSGFPQFPECRRLLSCLEDITTCHIGGETEDPAENKDSDPIPQRIFLSFHFLAPHVLIRLQSWISTALQTPHSCSFFLVIKRIPAAEIPIIRNQKFRCVSSPVFGASGSGLLNFFKTVAVTKVLFRSSL